MLAEDIRQSYKILQRVAVKPRSRGAFELNLTVVTVDARRIEGMWSNNVRLGLAWAHHRTESVTHAQNARQRQNKCKREASCVVLKH